MIPDEKNTLDDDHLHDAGEELAGDHPDDDSDDDNDDGDGDDQAALALNTPEPARALQATDPKARGKGDPKAKKRQKKGKAAEKDGSAEDGRAVGVTIGDAALGFEESSGEEKPHADAQAQDFSAFDRDESTDPDMDSHETELLGILAGLREKPWENEKLSLTERMMLKQGYDRNVEALKQQQAESDPGAKEDAGKDRKTLGRGVAAAATVAVAAGAVAAGIKGGAEKGPAVAGVSRGPQRAADQEKAQAPLRTETRKTATDITLRQQARQNADDVTLRRMGQGLAASLTAGKATSGPRQAGERDDPAERLLRDLIEDLAIADHAGASLQVSMPQPDPDPDRQFRQMMDMIYMTLGTETLMNVSPYRVAGWDERRLEQKENSADVTVAPEPEKGPDPEMQYRRDMQINIGPGGAG